MCNIKCLDFAEQKLNHYHIANKDIIEVGSKNVNGSVRDIAFKFKPKSYIGVDIKLGKYVDMICDVHKLTETFGKESFDAVINTEMLEHVSDWRSAINNMKAVLKPDGHILITTRSHGFRIHSYPDDWWRYELSDMQDIFNDFKIMALESDTMAPGVFVFARKLPNAIMTDLSNIKLFNVKTRCRVLTAD